MFTRTFMAHLPEMRVDGKSRVQDPQNRKNYREPGLSYIAECWILRWVALTMSSVATSMVSVLCFSLNLKHTFFFFQAEDGIRDWSVTGVQTCAFFFSSRRRHTRLVSDWSSDVCSSDLKQKTAYEIGQ